jgi:hypothetical protein
MSNIARLNNTTFLEAGAYRVENGSNKPMKQVIRENILADYRQGIKTANITVIPSDVKTLNNIKVKTWRNGDIFKLNEIVRVEDESGRSFLTDANHNDVYWRIVGRKVKYDGEPLLDLEFMEVKRR